MGKVHYIANSQFFYFQSCLGLRVLGSTPSQSARPGNSNADRHNVILQAFAYKTATPTEATSTFQYLYVKIYNLATCSNLNSGKLVVLK